MRCPVEMGGVDQAARDRRQPGCESDGHQRGVVQGEHEYDAAPAKDDIRAAGLRRERKGLQQRRCRSGERLECDGCNLRRNQEREDEEEGQNPLGPDISNGERDREQRADYESTDGRQEPCLERIPARG